MRCVAWPGATTTDGQDVDTRRRGFSVLRAFLLAAALVAQCAPAASREPAAHLGVAVTPRNFPAHTAQEVDAAFVLAAELGDQAVLISQWSQLDLPAVRQMLDKARAAGLDPVVGLSPTALANGRKDLDLPLQVRLLAGKPVSFANPVVRATFRTAARELAALAPRYLCLATEINLLAMQRLDEFLHFASLYKEAYREVKRVSPGTRVFVSFQWEWMRILDATEPDRVAEHSKVVDIFRPELDLVAITTYPAPFHAAPENLPADYYGWLHRHIRDGDEVLLMEVGWPTAGAGSEAEQARFIQRLPGLLRGVPVIGIDWALLHDVDHPAFDANLRTVGLLARDGREKQGFDAFRALRVHLAIAPR